MQSHRLQASHKTMASNQWGSSLPTLNYRQARQGNQMQGMCANGARNVIVVSSDQEEKQLFDKRLQDLHFKYEVVKAQLTKSRFNVVMAITRELMNAPSQNKAQLLHEFIVKFITQRIKIDPEKEYFCPRIDIGLEPDPGHIYETKYLLYGIDLLEMEKIRLRFLTHAPRVTKLNGSHCLLQFTSPLISQDFLRSNVLNFRQELLIPLETNPKILAKNWVQLNTYYQIIFMRKLFIRNLTQLDQQQLLKNKEINIPTFSIDLIKNQLQSYFLSNDMVKKAMMKLEQEQIINEPKPVRYPYKRRAFQQPMPSPIPQARYHSRSRTREKERHRFDNKNGYQKYKISPIKSHAFQRPIWPQQKLHMQEPPKPTQSNPIQNKPVYQIPEVSGQNRMISDFTSPPRKMFESKAKIQQPQVSSDFLNVQSQLQRFHLNSSQFSSIFQKSKHQISGVPNMDENNQSSILNSHNLSSNILNSNVVASQASQNYSQTLLELQVEQVHKSSEHHRIREEEIEDEEICSMLQINSHTNPKSNISEINFMVTSKPIDRDEIFKEKEQIVPAKVVKKPKKKQVDKATPSFIDLE